MLPTIQLPLIIPKMIMQSMSEVYDWGLIDLNIPQAHKETMGEDIKVAVLDSGESEHFEVQNNKAGSANFTDSPTIVDRQSHSTMCSGIIGAEKNGRGIIGVAPKCKLYFAKAMDDSGTGEPSSIVNAVGWCIDQKVDIISISAGMYFDFPPLHNIIKKAYDQNIIVIAAAGNEGTQYNNVAYPARYDEAIGVAAYDKHRQIAPFSSRGLNVMFALPGVDIYSTYLHNIYAREDGTSFSCPILSGICALILAKHRKVESKTPCTNTIQMLEHLKKYSIKLGDPQAFGFGTINVEGALNET